MVKDFIRKYPHTDYSLSIHDSISSNTVEIICDYSEIPQIAEYIYDLEQGTPLTFIGLNSLSDSYVVGMHLTKGRIEFGSYKAENGKLIKL